MSTIMVRCLDQTLQLTNTPVIASGGVNENHITFEFCSQWDGFAKTAVFYNNDRGVSYQVLDENDTCVIPAAALSKEGILHISVFGCNAEGTVRTSEVIKYELREGAVTSITEPEQGVYEQIMAGYSEAITRLKDIGPLTSVRGTTHTLLAGQWVNNTQTLIVENATADNIKVISPTAESAIAYGAFMVLASAEGAGTITFTCDTTPIRDLDVNILIMG